MTRYCIIVLWQNLTDTQISAKEIKVHFKSYLASTSLGNLQKDRKAIILLLSMRLQVDKLPLPEVWISTFGWS
jgi:hypothetical protein